MIAEGLAEAKASSGEGLRNTRGTGTRVPGYRAPGPQAEAIGAYPGTAHKPHLISQRSMSIMIQAEGLLIFTCRCTPIH
eukprot:1103919-Rhodomonas_salina.1